jgi:hypothetical protein
MLLLLLLIKASKETHWSVESSERLVHGMIWDALMIVRRIVRRHEA